jgi:predicted lysophospholipase L1 biosynthesis ABC-type transport system permease subunit
MELFVGVLGAYVRAQSSQYLRGRSEFEDIAPNYISIFIEKAFNKAKKHYILTFIFPHSNR